MIEIDEEDKWWLEEAYDWTEDFYYQTLADYFAERYEKLTNRRITDCE